MNDEMGDEKFEEFLQREAESYNAPPANVPRDEMFAAITAARAEGLKTEDRRPKTGNRSGTPRLVWIGMAATLVIGVAIGKFALTRNDAAAPALAASQRSSGALPAITDTTGGSYALATTEQLVRAEALLTAYRSAAPNAGVDKQLSGWARDVLSNTRLLLDSPAADDPARRRLLQDLELVLVQMVQRSPAAGAGEERAHIDRSLDRTQVLSRLRSALPAGRNN
jgi:hypothetical protein